MKIFGGKYQYRIDHDLPLLDKEAKWKLISSPCAEIEKIRQDYPWSGIFHISINPYHLFHLRYLFTEMERICETDEVYDFISSGLIGSHASSFHIGNIDRNRKNSLHCRFFYQGKNKNSNKARAISRLVMRVYDLSKTQFSKNKVIT